MEIIFVPKNTADLLMNYPLEEIESKYLKDIKGKLENIDSNFELKEVNLGPGADWILIWCILHGVTSVFLLGDKIEKNIEGWVKLGERIKSLFSKVDGIYLDRDAVKLIALQYLAEKYNMDSFSLIKETTEEIIDLSTLLGNRKPKDFISKPFNVHFLTFKINDNVKTMLSVRSDGKVIELYSFDENFHVPF